MFFLEKDNDTTKTIDKVIDQRMVIELAFKIKKIKKKL